MSQLPVVKETWVPGENLCQTQVTDNFVTCPGWYSTPGSGERQLAVGGNSVGSRPNFRGRLIAEIFERLIDHGRPIEGKLKEKYNKKKPHENRRRNGRVMGEWWMFVYPRHLGFLHDENTNELPWNTQHDVRGDREWTTYYWNRGERVLLPRYFACFFTIFDDHVLSASARFIRPIQTWSSARISAWAEPINRAYD